MDPWGFCRRGIANKKTPKGNAVNDFERGKTRQNGVAEVVRFSGLGPMLFGTKDARVIATAEFYSVGRMIFTTSVLTGRGPRRASLGGPRDSSLRT